jgi:hypothetical protein
MRSVEFETANMPITMHKILFLLTPFCAARNEEYIQHSPVYGHSLPCVSAQKRSGQPMGKFLMANCTLSGPFFSRWTKMFM